MLESNLSENTRPNEPWRVKSFLMLALAAVLLISCDESSLNSPENQASIAIGNIDTRPPGAYDGPVSDFSPVAYDLDHAPNGSILVTQNNLIREIRKGKVKDVIEIPTIPGSPVNGLAMIGRRSFFATSGGLDLAAGAGVWHITGKKARLIGDIKIFENQNDPDATGGPQWKDPACEEDPAQGFSAGPQSNPYHLKAISGSTVLVADAAGNSLLSVKKNGNIDWVAVFTPPVDGSGNYRFLKQAESDATIDCFVQPVPTAVGVAPNGDLYVGELTGVSPADFGAPGPTTGISRVWKIKEGARNVACPSTQCTVAFGGLTSVVDLEFGPDGYLYIVEYDENNWFQATALGNSAGGTINKCNINNGTCQVVESRLPLPIAISFDKWGNLYVLENNLVVPTVRRVNLP